MAATIARARGYSNNGTRQARETTRLGHRCAEAEANTWRTFAKVTTYADGSGTVQVTRNGSTLHAFAWGSENVNP